MSHEFQSFAIYADIINFLNDDIKSILALLSTCKYLNTNLNSPLIWRRLCSHFRDFDRLEAIHRSVGTDWLQIYKDRISGLLKEHNIKVGDPQNPEYTVGIFIYGDGSCFTARNYESTPYDGHLTEPQEFMVPLVIYQDLVNDFSSNYFAAGADGDYERYILPSIHSLRVTIIDIHVNNTIVLMLTQDGKVLELIFTPSYAQEFSKYQMPSIVSFPAHVEIIRSLDVANFAIDTNGSLYVWSIIDHPITTEKIKTDPLCITVLDQFTGKYDIIDSPDVENHTRVLYKETYRDPITRARCEDEKHIDIPNEQIMMLIMQEYFDPEELDELAQTVADTQ